MTNVFNSSMRDQLPRPAYQQNQDICEDSIYSSEKRFSDYGNELNGIPEAGSSYLDGTGLNNSE